MQSWITVRDCFFDTILCIVIEFLYDIEDEEAYMKEIEAERVVSHATRFHGKPVFLHLEVNPGAYLRNGTSVLTAFHLKGEGPYRVFLELESAGPSEHPHKGLIQVNDITHMHLEDGLLILTGYDDKDRIAQTIEISLSPFPV